MTPESPADIRVFPDPETLSLAAAKLFVTLSREAVASRGKFPVALSGGSTPEKFYALLAAEPYRDIIDWRNVHVFWADERCVPEDDPESNFKLAYDMFLSKVPVPGANVHRVKGELGPARASGEYEAELRRFFGPPETPSFDFIVLGAGEDGHTASLFPGSSSVAEKAALAVPVYPGAAKLDRVTLTLPVLNNAGHVLFLVTGRAKADIVAKILGPGKNKERYPAGLVRPVRGRLSWFLDKEAAAKIVRSS